MTRPRKLWLASSSSDLISRLNGVIQSSGPKSSSPAFCLAVASSEFSSSGTTLRMSRNEPSSFTRLTHSGRGGGVHDLLRGSTGWLEFIVPRSTCGQLAIRIQSDVEQSGSPGSSACALHVLRLASGLPADFRPEDLFTSGRRRRRLGAHCTAPNRRPCISMVRPCPCFQGAKLPRASAAPASTQSILPAEQRGCEPGPETRRGPRSGPRRCRLRRATESTGTAPGRGRSDRRILRQPQRDPRSIAPACRRGRGRAHAAPRLPDQADRSSARGLYARRLLDPVSRQPGNTGRRPRSAERRAGRAQGNNLDEVVQAAKSGTIRDKINATFNYHYTIATNCGNPYFAEVFERLHIRHFVRQAEDPIDPRRDRPRRSLQGPATSEYYRKRDLAGARACLNPMIGAPRCASPRPGREHRSRARMSSTCARQTAIAISWSGRALPDRLCRATPRAPH